MGRTCKEIIDRIDSLLYSNLKVNEWKTTGSVITWFRNINIEVMFHLEKVVCITKEYLGSRKRFWCYYGSLCRNLWTHWHVNAVITRKKHSSENTGLNRDDDLSIFRNASRPELKKLKSPYRKYSRKKC